MGLLEVAKGKPGFFRSAYKAADLTTNPKHHRDTIKAAREAGASRRMIAGGYVGSYGPPVGVGVIGGAAAQKGRDKRKLAKAFSTKTENSSPAVSTTRRGPVGPGQTNSLHARTGAFAGKTRNVGRRESRDANSSPRVTRVQPRTPDGRWVSHDNDLKIIHPSGRVTRQPKSSALGIYRKGRGNETTGYVEKAASQATGVVMHNTLYGRGNSRFGGSGTHGRRLAD